MRRRFHIPPSHVLAPLALLALMLVGPPFGWCPPSEADEKPAAAKAAPPAVAPLAPAEGLVEGEAVAPRPRVSPLRPMMVEMRAVLDEERKQVEALTVRFKAATDATSALAIQREIERVKTQTEATLLRVQATHARKAGRQELAAQLELAAQEILSPAKRAEPSAVRPPEEALRSQTSR